MTRQRGWCWLYCVRVLMRPMVCNGRISAQVVTSMAQATERPIIFALSNPTSKSELAPANALKWTDGKVIYAAGSPYAPVTYNGRTFTVPQGNNLYIFPGLGLGAYLSQAAEVSEGMVVEAAEALADAVPAHQLQQGQIYPPLNSMRAVSARVARAVMLQARKEGVARLEGEWPEDVLAFVERRMWGPEL